MHVPGYANKTSNMLVRLVPVVRSILDVKRQEAGKRRGWAERQSNTWALRSDIFWHFFTDKHCNYEYNISGNLWQGSFLKQPFNYSSKLAITRWHLTDAHSGMITILKLPNVSRPHKPAETKQQHRFYGIRFNQVGINETQEEKEGTLPHWSERPPS